MDVYEYENLTARKDYRGKPLDDSLLSKLLAMDQVLFTIHTAFYTDQATRILWRVRCESGILFPGGRE